VALDVATSTRSASVARMVAPALGHRTMWSTSVAVPPHISRRPPARFPVIARAVASALGLPGQLCTVALDVADSTAASAAAMLTTRVVLFTGHLE
jgi:hypothetical protein